MARSTRQLLIASLLLVLAACGSDDADDPLAEGDTTEESTATSSAEEDVEDAGAPGEVVIADFTFGPEDITVSTGTTVTWTNEDEAAHSVADRELDFDSGNMAEGDTFEFTYDEAGEYPYVCGIHNYMRGTVTVE